MATSTPPRSRSSEAVDRILVRPQDDSYDLARRAWNLAVDQRPAAIALPATADEVAAAVRYAAADGLRVAPQGTGHGSAPLGDLSDTMLLRTERMRRVEVDPHRRIARVEAGAVWLEVVEAAARYGLAALAGSSPDVGVAGYTLGGGMSFLSRRYGLAANRVVSIDAVLADGRRVRADRGSEPDLFWAMRGGGGNFAVATALEIELLPIQHAYAGHLWFEIERGSEVMHAWHELTRDARLPDELTTVGRFLNLPDVPEIPEPVRGGSFVIVEAYHVGEPAQADELLAPLRALGPVNDTIATVPMPALSHLHMDPEQPMPGVGDGAMLSELAPKAIDALVEVAGASANFPLVSVEVRHLEGELRRSNPCGGALSAVDASYALYAVGVAATPELAEATDHQVRAVKEKVSPWTARHMYLNFADTPRDPASFWSARAHDRLRQIKSTVDPDNRLRGSQPVE